MPATHSVCITILLAVLLLFDRCFGYPSIRQRQSLADHCPICGDSCENCEFGVVTTEACGNVDLCAKGPDEECGGHGNILGICGEGMFCKCNHCIGCSSVGLNSFKCSTKFDPCVSSKLLFTHFDRFGRLPTAM